MSAYKRRRIIVILLGLLLLSIPAASLPFDELPLPLRSNDTAPPPQVSKTIPTVDLADLPVKGRAPKTGYNRALFGGDWSNNLGCDTRNIILLRDLKETVVDDECTVMSGRLLDPYTAESIPFKRGATTSDDVQIDHVVAVSNAWQTGAQQLTSEQRVAFYNDPLNLLAVSGQANEQKSDGDAATWLPANKGFRCEYVKRQMAVKAKYGLWLTSAEKDAMGRVLRSC